MNRENIEKLRKLLRRRLQRKLKQKQKPRQLRSSQQRVKVNSKSIRLKRQS